MSKSKSKKIEPETEYEPATEAECNWFLTCSNTGKFIPMSKTIDEFSLYIN